MKEAVIVSSVRTGLAKSYRGSFNQTRPDEMLSHVLKAAVERVPKLDKGEVEDVIAGCGFPEGPQGMNVARIALLGAGFKETTAGTTVNRFCSSGLQAIAMAAHQIQAEGADVAIGAGVESITMGEGKMNMNDLLNPRVSELWPGIYMPMGQTAEVVAERYKVSREDQDNFALRSQQRYAAAQQKGLLADEIVAMKATWARKNKATGEVEMVEGVVDKDECNRPETTLEMLAKLPSAFKEDGSVTAGNASQLSDGASATVLMSAEAASKRGIEPLGIFRGFAVAGCRPEEMGIGPVFAIPKLLARHGLKIEDIDLVELNEAFAAQVIACLRELPIDPERLNVNGGAIALGHPVGATGAILTLRVAKHLVRHDKELGVVTMCIGGGQALAALFRRV
jgi:acetyl-CoA acetyltransferase family protein